MQRKIAIIGLALVLAVSGQAFGQAQRGTIQVNVTSADDGALLPGATIEAKSDQTLTSRLEATGTDGRVDLVALDPASNYVVTVTLEGFSPARIEDVRVRAGQTAVLNVELQLAEFGEEMVITGQSPVVDTTSTTAGQEITLELTEALPTGRSYQSYLQLVPGVQDAMGTTQNPASRSGINYRDVDGNEGDVGRSTDNLYYFDGINVTDRTEGTNGADLNTEIIQEQSILTGAIPAEFIGVPGLVSNVVTKSGGNQFSGSVNYYFIDDSLVEDNEHFADETFSVVDTAATLGGPIVRDKAWFFGSYRRVENERDLVDRGGVFLRHVESEADQAFGKVTWSITSNDLLTGIYLTDPTERDGSFLRDTPNSADSTGETGGERWSLSYNRVWGSAAFEAGATDHFADLNSIPKNRDQANQISFAPGVVPGPGQARLGGAGVDTIVERSTDSVRGSFEYLFDTGLGDHAVKIGVVDWSSDLFENPRTVGDPPATYISLDARSTDGSILLCEILGSCGERWSLVDFGASSDEINNFNQNLTAQQRQGLVDAGWDENGDGIFSASELANNMTFSSTAGNPHGKINYTRDLETQAGPSNKSSESTHYFIQDSWQWNRWSVNAGVRVEDTTFIDDTGADVGTFDTEIAPRVSVSYDIKGNGRSSVGVFYGEYYDAFRDNAIDFAGSLQGRVIEEQVWVEPLNDWVNFRFRGGTAVQDAFFAPRIETPVTEEIQIQYKQDLGRNMMFEINLIDRETTNIAEDYGSIYYDPAVYVDFGGPDPNDPSDRFFLGPGFFGFSNLAAIPTNLNFLIGTLPDASFRDWQGLELIFRKRYSDNWQLLASYNYADGDANSYSDSNFDGAGDVIFLDPRAPNITGTTAGLVEHLFKVHGSYRWNNGIQAGGSYRWNSGVVLNRNGTQAFARSIPASTDTPFAFGGWSGNDFESTWIAGDAIGFIDGESYGVLDVRGSYVWTPGNRFEVDFFLDIFNLLDDQATIRVEDLESGGNAAFLEGIDFLEPRRYNLGARLRF